jgi:hypothetical protein
MQCSFYCKLPICKLKKFGIIKLHTLHTLYKILLVTCKTNWTSCKILVQKASLFVVEELISKLAYRGTFFQFVFPVFVAILAYMYFRTRFYRTLGDRMKTCSLSVKFLFIAIYFIKKKSSKFMVNSYGLFFKSVI